MNCVVFFVFLDMVARTDCKFKLKETERLWENNNEKVSLLYSAWSAVLTKSTTGGNEYLKKHGISGSILPEAPHLENCKVKTELYDHLDKRTGNENFPPWTSWKGFLDTLPVAASNEQFKNLRQQVDFKGAYPPWVCSLLFPVFWAHHILFHSPYIIVTSKYANEVALVSIQSLFHNYFLFV